GISLFMCPDLFAAVANLVRRFDALLEHYQVAEEISTQEDPSLLWWHWEIEEIEPELLEKLHSAAECLVETINEVDCQVFLDKWCPEGIVSLWRVEDDGSEDKGGGHAGATIEETQNGGPQSRPPFGFLGLFLDKGKFEVRRDGYPPVPLSGAGVLW